MKTQRQIEKELWDLELELSSGFKSWHDIEVALCRKKQLEKQLSITRSQMAKAKKAVKKVVKATKKPAKKK